MFKRIFNALSALAISLFTFSLLYNLLTLHKLLNHNSNEQIDGSNIDSSNSDSNFLFYHLCVYVSFYSLSVWSYFRCVFSDPGKIVKDNEQEHILLYLLMYENCLKSVISLNKTHRKNLEKEISEKYSKAADKQSDSEVEDELKLFYKVNKTRLANVKQCSSNLVDSLTDPMIKEQCKLLQVHLSKCKVCSVLRVPKTHHCAQCRSCVVKRDSHFAIVNNCVGLFNHKFFLLYLFYTLLIIVYSVLLFGYYFYKYSKVNFSLLEPNHLSILTMGHLTIAIGLGVYLSGHLYFQIVNLDWDALVIDFREKRFLEKRTKNEILQEIFGVKSLSNPLHLLLPLRAGGFKSVFNSLIQRKKTNNSDEEEQKFT